MRLNILLALGISLCATSSWAQIFHIIPVATSTPNGFTVNTPLQAQQTATATSTPGIAQFDVSYNQGTTPITLTNAIGTWQGPSSSIPYGGVWVTFGSGGAFVIDSTTTIPVSLNNMSVTASTVTWPVTIGTMGTGGALSLNNFYCVNSGAAGCLVNNFVFVSANQLTCDRTYLYANGATGANGAFRENATVTTAGSMKFTSSVLRSATFGYTNVGSTSTNKIIILDHVGVFDCATGISTKSGMGVSNVSFLGNGVDFASTGAGGVTTDIYNSEGSSQIANGGTNCYLATKAGKFCNSNNYWEGPQDPNLNKATTSLDGTASLNGVLWGGTHPLGPMALWLAVCESGYKGRRR